MIKEVDLLKFVKPYYENKDIMHNLWHIQLVEKKLCELIEKYNYNVSFPLLKLALYFHGFVYSNEKQIRNWLKYRKFPVNDIDKIISISLESQRPEEPKTIEGKLLHDAHVLEGGETYLVIKTLITGSLRNQTLSETINYLKENVVNKNKCYLPETKKLLHKSNKYAINFLKKSKDISNY